MATDFESWRDVRLSNFEWLVPWEPKQNMKNPESADYRKYFESRCANRDREMQLGTAWSFGIFVSDQLAGEINISNITRGAFQSGHVGYWIDENCAGNGYTPEALVLIMNFLHGIRILIADTNKKLQKILFIDYNCLFH